MSDQIYKLIYASAASSTMNEAMLIDILAKARENNHALNVTGILLYHDENFFQLLEGEKETVNNLFAKIEQDPRHRRLLKLLEESSDSRDFPDWSMGYKRLNRQDDEPLVEGLNDILEMPSADQEGLKNISRKARILIDTFKATNRLR